MSRISPESTALDWKSVPLKMLIIYQDGPSLSYRTSLSISFYEREITRRKISDSSNIVPRRVDNSAGRLCAKEARVRGRLLQNQYL